MPSRSARALSSIRAAMTKPPSVSRGLRGGVFLKSRASCLSLSVFIGLEFRLFRGHQHRRTFVLHEDDEEFCRFGFAGVSPDDVNILGAFIEGLTRRQSDFLPASYLHDDRAFEDINKPMRVVPMDWVLTAWRILDQEHETFLAWKIRHIFREELSHLCFLGLIGS